MTGLWKKILSIAAAVAVLSGLVVTSFAVNNHFAKTEELTEEVYERMLLAERLDNKIIMDKINYWETKIDRIEEKYDGKEMPREAKLRIKDALREIRELEKQLKAGS